MGKITTSVQVRNALNEDMRLECEALVDTGANYLVLPSAWREKLGPLELRDTVELEAADQSKIIGEIRGPVTIQMPGFMRVSMDLLFIDMQPRHGQYEPLIGHFVLQQSGAIIDMVEHRLLKRGYFDLKNLKSSA